MEHTHLNENDGQQNNFHTIIDKELKWNRVVKFMEKNPKFLLNVMPTPKKKSPLRIQDKANRIVNLVKLK